jgi:ADP-heptose:LPS heptosyltransferase
MQKKLLIVHQGAIGDIVSIFPAIIRLKEKFRLVDIICKKSVGELSVFLKLTDRCYTVETALFSSLFSGAADYRIADIFQSYDEVMLFSYSLELEDTISRIAGRKIFRTDPRPEAFVEIHILDHILERLFQNGLAPDAARPEANFFKQMTDQMEDSCRNRDRILIHPGSGSKRKNWGLNGFIEVFEKIKSIGMNPGIIAGPAEENIELTMSKRLPAGFEIHRLESLPELAKLFVQSGGFIGNDSGISHLAAFLGIPTVVIFGPSDPKRWKPFGRSVTVIRPATDCSPCFEIEKSNCAEAKCLELTTPEMVVEAFMKIIKE